MLLKAANDMSSFEYLYFTKELASSLKYSTNLLSKDKKKKMQQINTLCPNVN